MYACMDVHTSVLPTLSHTSSSLTMIGEFPTSGALIWTPNSRALITKTPTRKDPPNLSKQPYLCVAVLLKELDGGTPLPALPAGQDGRTEADGAGLQLGGAKILLKKAGPEYGLQKHQAALKGTSQGPTGS